MSDKKVKNNTNSASLHYKSYSINEIMNAGGTMAFANKLGKNPANISLRLKALPKEAFLSDEEVKQALILLKNEKHQ